MTRWVILVMVMMTILSAGGVMVFAQDDDEAVDDAVSWLDTIRKGGGIGYLIITLSVVMFALAIECAVSLRSSVVLPPEMLDEIEKLFEEEEYEEALDLCATQRNYLTKVIGAGLSRIGSGYTQMDDAMGEAAAEEEMMFQHKIGWLSLIGNISPMMGLFGTVSGMIKAFQTIERLGANVQPADLGRGISEALVTTLLGLAVAIPSLAIFIVFGNKVQRLMADGNAVVGELMDRFRPVE